MSFEEVEGINGTLVWYGTICQRQVWYMAHKIAPDGEQEYIAYGRMVHELFYRNRRKELLIDGTIKIDLLDGRRIVGEIKASSKALESARIQLAFYLYYLKLKGVEVEGELLIPKERRTIRVRLNRELEERLREIIATIREIQRLPKPPKPVKIPRCSRCGYREYCWV
ncbi:MAG: CRISPR-associated protein Cas4 [Epsilonproteobacteria bacterium]|nr:CRISPR-associated protein Cas4 [Campylobacterota bacterium]NPA56158.1 CRISPR-associated protein Cas4 [Campylobacterota bacterium]